MRYIYSEILYKIFLLLFIFMKVQELRNVFIESKPYYAAILACGYHIKCLIKRDTVPQVLKHPLSPSTYKAYICYSVIC